MACGVVGVVNRPSFHTASVEGQTFPRDTSCAGSDELLVLRHGHGNQEGSGFLQEGLATGRLLVYFAPWLFLAEC